MSILIKGMEMPKEGSWKTVRIYPDGTCAVPNWQGDCPLIQGAEAVPVPPHGRCIDADALRCLYDPHDYGLDGEQADEYDRYHVSLPVIRQNIDDMPTIIEAEPGAHDCENCKWFGGLMCDHVDENYKCLGWEAEGGE